MTITGTIIHLAAISILAIVLSTLAMLTVKWTGVDIKDPTQRNNPLVLTIAGIFNLLFIVAVVLILKFWDNQSIGILGFSFKLSDFIFAILVLLLSVGLALSYLLFLHNRRIITIEWEKNLLPVNFKVILNLLLGLIVLFIAALQEEILFRGYFAYILLPYGFFYAITISTIIFTIWHFLTNKVNLFQTIDWLLGGTMLFYLFWLSGSIWVAALIHFSRNFTNVLVFNISGFSSVLSFKKPMLPQHKTIYTVIYSFIIMLIGFVYYSFIH